MKKVILIVAMMMYSTGCTLHNTKDITDRLQPTELYESYGVKPVNLKARSKCSLSPTVNIVNVETRVEDYTFTPPLMATRTINPKELMNGVVEYLKYGFNKSQIVIDNKSPKIVQMSFKDAKLLPGFWSIGGMIQVKVDIPETKYSEIYEAVDNGGGTPFTPVAYAIHGVTRQIIDDHVIQDYVLCKDEYLQSIKDQKNKDETASKSLSQKLQELKTALDNGLITKEEYQLKRKELLEKH